MEVFESETWVIPVCQRRLNAQRFGSPRVLGTCKPPQACHQSELCRARPSINDQKRRRSNPTGPLVPWTSWASQSLSISRIPHRHRSVANRTGERASADASLCCVTSVILMLVMAFLCVPMVVPASAIASFFSIALVPASSLYLTLLLVITIMALIFGIVFLRTHKIDGCIAGVVLVTMLAPVFCMTWRNVQVDRGRRVVLRLNDHGPGVDNRRRTFVSEIDLTIHAGHNLPGQDDSDV